MTRSAPSLLFEQVRSGRISSEALDWLAEGFATFDRADGQLPMERCLRLPTQAQRQRQQRDYWVCEAARLIGGDSAKSTAARVGSDLDAFMRGTWREWRALADPPYGTSELRCVLFRLAKSLGGRPRPCDMRLAQILAKTSSV